MIDFSHGQIGVSDNESKDYLFVQTFKESVGRNNVLFGVNQQMTKVKIKKKLKTDWSTLQPCGKCKKKKKCINSVICIYSGKMLVDK